MPTAYPVPLKGSFCRERMRAYISVMYTYDALHRPTIKNYSDATPDVFYEYYLGDAADNNTGHLKFVANGVSGTSFGGYDALGRVSSTTQTFHGTPASSYNFGYSWWLTDALKQVQYPSGFDNLIWPHFDRLIWPHPSFIKDETAAGLVVTVETQQGFPNSGGNH